MYLYSGIILMQSCYRECVPSKKRTMNSNTVPRISARPRDAYIKSDRETPPNYPPSDQRRANMLVKYDTKQENQVAREY